MSRTKSVLDEYLQNKNYLSQNVKFVPMDYEPRKMYLYRQPTYYPNKKLNSRHKAESRPKVKPYYVPVAPKHEIQSSDETFYKHTGISEHYLYQKPYDNYFSREPAQKTTPRDYSQSVKYVKSPKTIREEKLSRYYEHVNHNSGDYIREEDYYGYNDDENMDYFELERKLDHENLYLRHDELYYDYIPENPYKKRNINVNKYSSYFPQYAPRNIPQVEKRNYYYREKNVNKNIYKEMPTKFNMNVEKPKPFLEPIGQNFTKLDSKKSDAVSEISTIYERNFNLRTTNAPTCNVSSQTSNCDTVEYASPRMELKECLSKTTQTLELDFRDKKLDSCDKECQTMDILDMKPNCNFTFNKKDIEVNEKAKLTESVIRWTQKIILYFLGNMYNCQNPEQIVFFAQTRENQKLFRIMSNHSFSQPNLTQKKVRKAQHRKCKFKRNTV